MSSRAHNQRCFADRWWWMRVLMTLELVVMVSMIIAFFGRLVIQRMVNEGIKSATLLDPYTSNSTWNRMVRNDRPGAPPDMLYAFMYNITNLPEVHRGEKPHLEEVGPYVYRKTRVKEHIRFGREGFVFYREFIAFHEVGACDGPPPADATAYVDPHGAERAPGEPLWPGGATGRRGGSTGTDSPLRGPQGAESTRAEESAADASDITPGRLGRPRCARDDVITTLNLPLLGVLRAVDEVSSFKAFVEVAIKQFFIQHKDSGKFDGLFMRRTAEQLLFGYDDELISAVAHLVPSLRDKAFFKLVPNMTTVEDAFPQNIMTTQPVRRPPPAPTPSPGPARHLRAAPDTRPDARARDPPADAATELFGGGPREGVSPAQGRGDVAGARARWPPSWLEPVLRPVRSVLDALDAWANPELPGWSYVEWQGHEDVSCWADGHVERVAGGSDALQFPPGLTAADPIYVYVPELFRMARLNVTGEVSARGVRLLQYKPDDRVAAPDPRFFTEVTGLMNVTACTAVGPDGAAAESSGPPVLMSFPHFCHVDPAVAAQTTGVAPCDPAVHDLWLGVEPATGITMAARKRLQVSSAFDGRHVAFDSGVRPTILPIFWADEAGELGADSAAQIHGQLYPALRAIRVLESRPLWLSLWIAAAALLCALAILSLWRPRAAPSAAQACGEPHGEVPPSNGERPSLAAAAAAAAQATGSPAAAQAGGSPVASDGARVGASCSRGTADPGPQRSDAADSEPPAQHAQQDSPSRQLSQHASAAEAACAGGDPAAGAADREAAVGVAAHDGGGAGVLGVPPEAALPYQLEVGWEGRPSDELATGMLPPAAGGQGPDARPPGSPTASIRSSRLGSEAVRSFMVRIDSD